MNIPQTKTALHTVLSNAQANYEAKGKLVLVCPPAKAYGLEHNTAK